eukprot:9491861-Pyramimonas_sp.AAC.1
MLQLLGRVALGYLLTGRYRASTGWRGPLRGLLRAVVGQAASCSAEYGGAGGQRRAADVGHGDATAAFSLARVDAWGIAVPRWPPRGCARSLQTRASVAP